MDEVTCFESLFAANVSNNENETVLQHGLLFNCTEISENAFIVVITYSVVFVAAVIGHLFSFSKLWKQFKIKKSRIFLLLLHLSLADLIVCLIIVPTEIFWRLSVQWEGGNFLCKATQYFRAFGLYLSSLILICLTVDRFISIIFQPDVTGVVPYRRIKWMIATAWIGAIVFSAPQAILFRVELHPNISDFRQCITSDPNDSQNFRTVKVYSIFSLAVMYFIPLGIIGLTYTVIFLKLIVISHDLARSSLQAPTELTGDPLTPTLIQEGSMSAFTTNSCMLQRESSTNVHANLTKAKIQTLLMTVVIIFAFIICWTPYAVMTLWYILDWEAAKKVDPRIQDALFLMVVSNSCVNPLIYNRFSQWNARNGRCFLCTNFPC